MKASGFATDPYRRVVEVLTPDALSTPAPRDCTASLALANVAAFPMARSTSIPRAPYSVIDDLWQDQAISMACQRVVDFLLDRQADDGSWSDWALPPGASGAWTTGYVGTQLASAAADRQPRVREAVLNAARWLLSHGHVNGGWGYNGLVDADANSTAWAIHLQCAANMQPALSCYAFLCSFQQPDGGFATFPATAGLGAWGRSHPDVTAVVVTALANDPSRAPACGAALQYLRTQRRLDGLWNAYWWTTPLYTSVICLSKPALIDPVETLPAILGNLLDMAPAGAFETALLLECLVRGRGMSARAGLVFRGGDRIRQLATSLLAQQLPDGSWPAFRFCA